MMRFFNSVKALYAAVVILFITVGIDSYVDFRKEAMNAQHLEINSGLERIVRYSGELTNMLMIAVLDQNILRAASYDTVYHQLETTMETLIELTQKHDSSAEIASLSMSYGELHGYEENIMILVKGSKWEDAHAALFDDAYVFARKTNEIDIETAVAAVQGELAATEEQFSNIRTIALSARIGSLVLLLWVGIMFSRRARKDLEEQVRLKNELADANEALEARVRERTADLEEKTRQVAMENEERLKSEARARMILNSAGDGIFGLDAKGRTTFINAAAEHLLGYGPDEVIGQGMHDLIHHSRADGSAHPREDCAMFHACRHGEEQHVSDEALWRKDGTSFSAAYSAMPIFDEHNHVEGAVIVFRDITERKRSEAELNKRLEELERFNQVTIDREIRMIELKKEINELREQLGEAGRYKIVS